jgi:hypothetical protein
MLHDSRAVVRDEFSWYQPWLTIVQKFPRLWHDRFTTEGVWQSSGNCFGWMLFNDMDIWFGPEEYHNVGGLKDLPADPRLDTWKRVLAMYQYQPCEHAQPQTGWQKIGLIYDHIGLVNHGIRQEASGRWSSKLGKAWLVRGHALHAFCGSLYGETSSPVS